MSAAQKQAQANFKKAIAYRKKTGCSLKQAFAHVKGSKVTGLDAVVKKGNKTSVLYTKAAKKKAASNKMEVFNPYMPNVDYSQRIKKLAKKKATTKKKVSQGVLFGVKKKATKKKTVSTHKDTKSHNVNIRVMSGYKKLAGLFDISAINDLDQLKKQYFKLVKIYHPDAGGTNEQFVKLKDEYDKLRDQILKGANLSDEEKKNEIVIDEALQTIVDNIINIDDIIIEVIGKWIWVSSKLMGFSNSSYALLKAAGLTYAKKAGKPYMLYKGVESKSRGGMSKEAIEKKYGKTKFEPRKGNRLNGVIKNKAKILAAFNRLKKGLDKRPI